MVFHSEFHNLNDNNNMRSARGSIVIKIERIAHAKQIPQNLVIGWKKFISIFPMLMEMPTKN